METFCCDSCSDMNKQYIGDGFDEFYDYFCGLKNNKRIGCHDTFDKPMVPPKWCPKVKALMKALQSRGAKN